MPRFHTKTIEMILEPVAQQVSQLVILHEEAEDGNAMPDLAAPVQAVSAAVKNLSKVGYDTCQSSKDEILKQDMPASLRRVEEACLLLVDASRLLKADPYSPQARKKLIDGSRGILQGTSSLLLCFDESEVRKIVRCCKSVLEYLAITEVVETMPDLLTFVKNLTPGLLDMTKQVDDREKELTHQVHREMLQRSVASVKQLIPILVSAIKTFVSTFSSGKGIREAQENRDYTVRIMSDEIQEIIRVLQLTTYDEDEWDADDITVMRKALNAIDSRMKQASDWLQDPNAIVGGVGERSLGHILEDAKKVAELCSDPAEAAVIMKQVGNIQSMMDSLAELRAAGQGGSPHAVSLAKNIEQQLKDLQNRVNMAVLNTEKAGVVKAAHTMDGRVEQAQRWLADPGFDDKGLGEQATRAVIAEGRKIANTLEGREKQDVLRLCDDVEKLTAELSELSRRGMGNSPQARAIARNLSQKLQELKKKIQDSVMRKVADDFMDVTTPLKILSQAALAPPDFPDREGNFQDKAAAFENHGARLVDTSKMLAATGGCSNKKVVEGIMNASDQLNSQIPQIVNAARIVLDNPFDENAQAHFELMKKEYAENVEKLKNMVDGATDSAAFIKANEEAMILETERTEESIQMQNPPGVVQNTSNIARRANRVVQVAKMEAENSEDPVFVQNVETSLQNLESTVTPMVLAAKGVSTNVADKAAGQRWRSSNDQLINAVRNVRKAVTPKEELPPPPPPFEEEFPAPPDLSGLNLQDDVDFYHQPPFAAPPPPVWEDAPPRPPLPRETAPPRPPPPPEEEEAAQLFRQQPQENQPIMVAAHNLHQEVKNWDSQDNELIAAAKKMALLMARLSQLVRGEGGAKSKKELITTAKLIAAQSEVVTRLANDLARQCTDKRMRTSLWQVCERIPTIGTQLKILSTVKATMLGAQGSEEDQEATEMLVGNAQNLMQSVRETVRAAEAASIKIRVDSGCTIRWVRMKPWYTS